MKKGYRSKTNTVMLLALAGSIISGATGTDWLDGDLQVAILSLIGLILRKFTDTKVDW